MCLMLLFTLFALFRRRQVLVYDTHTRAIISPLLSVSELRTLGVTLHMSIDAVRDAIPDVTAVYFVQPTSANVRLVVDDAASGKYRDFALHFAAPVPRPLLETMARGCVESGCVARVRRVVDQFLAFAALEHRLFSLNMPHSYAAYAAPGLSEAAVDEFCGSAASAVLCVFATLGVVPIIVSSRGGAAEAVARRLDALVRGAISAPGGVFSALAAGMGGSALGLGHHVSEAPVLPGGRHPAPLAAGAGARPVLVLADRDLDLATPLAHASTYHGLVDDTLGPIALNRVTISSGSGAAAGAASSAAGGGGWLSALEWATGGSKGGKGGSAAASEGRVVTLDADADPFWRRHSGDQFPSAIEAHEHELAEVVAREAEIRRSAGSSLGEGDGEVSVATPLDALTDGGAEAAGSASSSNSELIAAIDSLPALLRRKKILETHSTLLAAVMDRVAARMLPVLYECEANVWVAGGMDRTAALAILADGSKGSVADRTRLAAMHLLTCPVSAAAAAGGGGAAAVAAALAEEAGVCMSALRRSVGMTGDAPASAAGGPAGQAAPRPPVATGVDAAQQAAIDSAAAVLSYVRQWRATALLGASAGGGGKGGFGLGAFGLPGGGGSGGSFLSALSMTTGALLNKAAAQVTRLVQGDVRLPLTRLMQVRGMLGICDVPSACPYTAPPHALPHPNPLDLILGCHGWQAGCRHRPQPAPRRLPRAGPQGTRGSGKRRRCQRADIRDVCCCRWGHWSGRQR
jgi:sec1 family domain-containing protein 1